jgi:hypothetical protein
VGTWNVSLESYHPYLLPQEVSKTPTTLGTYGSLPKIRKGRFGSLRPLGVNFALVAHDQEAEAGQCLRGACMSQDLVMPYRLQCRVSSDFLLHYVLMTESMAFDILHDENLFPDFRYTACAWMDDHNQCSPSC